MIQGSGGIRDAYRRESVVETYVQDRFTQPLGAVLHMRQSAALVRLIEREQPKYVLEIAPGPARLTTDVARVFTGNGVLLDASMPMLLAGRGRLGPLSRWHMVQGDAFALPFRRQFDLVYSFRLIRHFDAAGRANLYAQIARVLRPGGLLVFDVVNEVASAPLRARAAPGEYQHFDALLQREPLKQELTRAGLDLVTLEGVHHAYSALSKVQVLVAPRAPRLATRLIAALDRLAIGEPLEWITVCRRA
jgi:ubiquinone/menaquinone biosynthesis C-methylase UbiE